MEERLNAFVEASFEQAMELTKDVSAAAALTDTECKAFWEQCMAVRMGGLVVEVGSVHIDPYVPDERGAASILASWVTMMHSINLPFVLLCMKTEEAQWELDRLCRDGIDLAFIDGDHEGPAVATDMQMVASRIKSGGVMMCHDYTHPHFLGLREAVDSFTASGWTKEGQYDSLGIWRRQ